MMVQQILDPVLLEKLHGGTERVDLTDDQGAVVGHYLPHSVYVEMGGIDRVALRDEALAEFHRGETVSSDEMLKRIENIKKYFESQK